MVAVSVIIPTYNRAEVLPRSIESVLNQTFSDFELIIVDDASTDATQKVVNSYNDDRIEYIRHSENRNGSAARNTGIRSARGEYIALLDSDDEWDPLKLEKQVSQLRSRSSEWVANYCRATTQRDSRLIEIISNILSHDAKHEGQKEIIKGLLTLSGFIHGGSTIIAKREVVEEIGGFDESFERNQDVEFTIRLAREGKIGYVDQGLVVLHESSRPSADTAAEAKNELFDAFQDEIQCLEKEGYNVRKYHNFILARYYIAEGDFERGFEYMRQSKPANLRQVFGLGYDLVKLTKSTIHA
jgi:glycosyltransferase involved in cell wall biosynthesis